MSEDVTTEESAEAVEESGGLGSLTDVDVGSGDNSPAWMNDLGEEFKGDVTLEKFKDISSLA